MNRIFAILTALWIGAGAAAQAQEKAPEGQASAAAPAVSETFRADAEALLRAPHRLSGTEEYAEAARHVERRLREIGVERVVVQEFPTLQTEVMRCELVAGDRALPLVPGRPNGIQPPISPPEGIEGELVDVGDGSDARLNAVSVNGRIAVMDYNSGTQWL